MIPLERNIRDIWDEWQQEGLRPKYANATIRYLDDGTEMDVIIAMFQYDIDVEDDDKIFFYAGDLESLCALCDEGGQDFVITDFYNFQMTI